MKRTSRIIAGAVALVFASSCAVILHPERKGNNSAPLDTVPLVVDIILFIPGLIPGIIAVVLDFGTGAIYLEKSGSNKPFLARRNGRNKAQTLHVRVVDDEGLVLEHRALTVVPPKRRGEPVALSLPDLSAAQWAGRSVHLEVTTEAGEPVSVPLM